MDSLKPQLSKKWCPKYVPQDVEEIEFYQEPCDLCLWNMTYQAYECNPQHHSIYLYPRVYWVKGLEEK